MCNISIESANDRLYQTFSHKSTRVLLSPRARKYNNSPTRRASVIKLHAAILDRDAFASGNELGNDTSWSAIIWNRLTRVLRTHAFRIDIDRMLNADSTTDDSSQPETNDNAVQGEISMLAR